MRGEGKLPTSTGEGSLPIPNHTMQRVGRPNLAPGRRGLGWNGRSGFGGDSKDGTRKPGSRKIRDGAQILWKNNFINLAIAAFLPVTRHVVIPELHVIEF